MRLSVQPNLPNAMTCLCLSSLKTLPIATEDTSAGVNVPHRFPLAGLQMTIMAAFE